MLLPMVRSVKYVKTAFVSAGSGILDFQDELEKPEKLAEILFKFENSPGSTLISGALARETRIDAR